MSDIFAEIVKLRKEGRKGALATIIETQGSIPSYESSKILIRDDGSIVGTVGGGCVEAEVWSVAQDVMREEKPRRLHFNLNAKPEYDMGLVCGGSLDIFVEPILSTPALYLFGAGHVSLYISKVASMAGFETVVSDDREAFANPERFPEAVATHAGDWEEVFKKLHLHEHSYAVIATRGHKGDLICLREALKTPARYVGMIGSKRKMIEFSKVLEARRRAAGTPGTDSLSRGTGDRRADPARDRRGGSGGDDRRAPQRRALRTLPCLQT